MDIPAQYSGGALKVRRVLQLATDLTGKPLSELRILDLACGPGTYSIEAARHGAKVVAIDARTERMSEGQRIAAELGLGIEFHQADVRGISVEDFDRFDVILVLGILYHLEAADALAVLKAVASMTDTVIVDTHISLTGDTTVELEGWNYSGHYYEEHQVSEDADQRRSKLLASIDNEQSFWFTRKSVTDLLLRAGFTSIMECYAPIEPNKTTDRVTFAARKGEPVALGGFPWLSGMEQAEIERLFPPETPKSRALPRRLWERFKRFYTGLDRVTP